MKVTMEKSSSTAIQSIMVNNTVVDEDALSADPISVELPTTWYNEDGTPTDQPEDTHLTSVKVAITTDATVSGVTLAGETQTGDDGELNDAKTTRTWTFTGLTCPRSRPSACSRRMAPPWPRPALWPATLTAFPLLF